MSKDFILKEKPAKNKQRFPIPTQLSLSRTWMLTVSQTTWTLPIKWKMLRQSTLLISDPTLTSDQKSSQKSWLKKLKTKMYSHLPITNRCVSQSNTRTSSPNNSKMTEASSSLRMLDLKAISIMSKRQSKRKSHMPRKPKTLSNKYFRNRKQTMMAHLISEVLKWTFSNNVPAKF